MKENIDKLIDLNNGLNRFEREIKSVKKTKVFKSMLEDVNALLLKIKEKLNGGEAIPNENIEIGDGN